MISKTKLILLTLGCVNLLACGQNQSEATRPSREAPEAQSPEKKASMVSTCPASNRIPNCPESVQLPQRYVTGYWLAKSCEGASFVSVGEALRIRASNDSLVLLPLWVSSISPIPKQFRVYACFDDTAYWGGVGIYFGKAQFRASPIPHSTDLMAYFSSVETDGNYTRFFEITINTAGDGKTIEISDEVKQTDCNGCSSSPNRLTKGSCKFELVDKGD